MNILITGANGFIGYHIAKQLLNNHHQITYCLHSNKNVQQLFPESKIIHCDFDKDTDFKIWIDRLEGIDVIINAVGIFHHSKSKTIWNIHYNTPKALFSAAQQKNVKKIIHISALGIENVNAPYAQSKLAIEKFLGSLAIPSIILKPSMVYGENAPGSFAILQALAALPIILLPGKGQQALQPVHVNDIATAVTHLIAQNSNEKIIIKCVGKEILTIKNIILTIRIWLKLNKTITISIPLFVINCSARIGHYFNNQTFNLTAIELMNNSNTAHEKDLQNFANILQRSPLSFKESLFSKLSSTKDRWFASLYFLIPLLKLSIAFLWIWSGLCSLFFFREQSLQLLQTIGLPPHFQLFILFSASFLNLFLGVSLIFNYHLKLIYLLQIFTIFIYTIIITFQLPSFWLEPFAPIAKNIPIILTTIVLYALE